MRKQAVIKTRRTRGKTLNRTQLSIVIMSDNVIEIRANERFKYLLIYDKIKDLLRLLNCLSAERIVNGYLLITISSTTVSNLHLLNYLRGVVKTHKIVLL